MGQKVRGRAGTSLGAQYDVPGGSIELGEIDARDIHAVHGMAETMFSERLSAAILSDTSGAVNQSTAIDVPILAFTTQPITRILGFVVITSVTARIADLCISIQNAAAAGDEVPIWLWSGDEDAARLAVAGVGINAILLVPDPDFSLLPNTMLGMTQPEQTPNLTMRGNTTAFGAGTVTVIVHTLVMFANIEGLGSEGLPVPSW